MAKNLKRTLSIILSALILTSVLAVMPITASAKSGDLKKSGDYMYAVLSDGTAEITGYTGSATKLKIPKKLGKYTVTSIGDWAFYGCKKLKTVKIGNGVKSIGTAFGDCTSLKSISIGSKVKMIDSDAFQWCTSLKKITVSKNNKKYTDTDGVLFNKSRTKLILYPAKKSGTSYKIPNSVKTIKRNAFTFCNKLKSIKIPNSVKKIGRSAFYGCKKLKSIKNSNSVKSIGVGAFAYCTNLKKITIPKSLKRIGSDAFCGCKKLKSLTIPKNTKKVAYDAFENCPKLTVYDYKGSTSTYAVKLKIGDTKLTVGDKTDVKVRYSTGKKVTFSSSDSTIAKVSSSRYKITALKEGTVTITAKIKYAGGKTKTLTQDVTVTAS